LTQFPTASDIGEARFGYAEVLFRQGELGDNNKWALASKQYQEIIDKDSGGPRGTEAALGLLVSTEHWSGLITSKDLSPEVSNIIAIYEDLYQKIQTELPKNTSNSEVGGQCAFRIGELYAKYQRDTEALSWFEKGLTDFPTSSSEEATATQLLVILLQQNKNEEIVTYIARFRKDNELSKLKGFQDALTQVEQQLSKQSCVSYSEKKDWLAAAKCFEAAYKTAPKEQAAALLFNAASFYEKAEKPEEARALFQELFNKYPTTKEAPNAILRSGYLSLRLLDVETSASALETFGKKFPSGKDTEGALFTAALIREASLQYEEAIADLTLIASILDKTNKSEANSTAFRIAKLKDQQGDLSKAQTSWEQFVKRKEIAKADVSYAYASLGFISWQRNKKPDAEKYCTQATALFKTVTDNKEEELFEAEPLARCAFYLAELQIQKVEAIALPKTFDEKKVEAWLKDTRAQTEITRKTLNQVKDFGATTWALGALFRAGQMSYVYAQNVEKLSQMATEKTGLAPEVMEALKTQTSSLADAARKDAEIAWGTCAEGVGLVRDPGIWLEQCEAMLVVLNPERYRQVSEWIVPATTEAPLLASPSLVTSTTK
jgi:hypothetical protein